MFFTQDFFNKDFFKMLFYDIIKNKGNWKVKNKFRFYMLGGAFCLIPALGNAAYPMYKNYNGQNGQIVYLPGANNNVIAANSVSATTPTRVTGMLPHVGTAATTAGRQYYQPADYDRLADSGLYVGFSAAYLASLMGGMHADYASYEDGYLAPGSFKRSNFKSDTVIPLQFSVGAAINSDIRVDFSYLRYSGLSYSDTAETDDGNGGYVESFVDGGAITANTTMLNVYYNIDSYTGYLAGGSLRPYIGAGVGISLNTIADYVVYDNSYYSYVDYPEDYPAYDEYGNPILTGVSDIYAYHNGGTMEQFAFALEGGLSTELDGGIKLDFFVRYANLGKVKTSGSVVVSQTDWLATGDGIPPYEVEAPYDDVLHYTNWYESGRLSMVDVGARLRLQF